MTDRIGQQLGSYRLLRLLGKGGFAEVYLGEHVYLKTQVAIKLLHASLNAEEIETFQGEARTVARLAHPHIVRVLDFAIQDETPYLVMEYAPGGTLRARHSKGAQLPMDTVLIYARQVAEALDYAHQQRLIHRDVKPENMLLNAREEVVLSDFGIATLAHSSRSQSAEDVVGTAAYMAPEQFLGKPRPASDQYALGIVVYEWLAGSRPFQGSFLEISGQHLHAPPPPLRAQRPDLSSEAEAVVLRALAKDPHERFPNVLAFADALEQSSKVLNEQTIPVGTSSAGLLEAASQATTRLSVQPTLVETATQTPALSPTWEDKPQPDLSTPDAARRRVRNRRPLLLVTSALMLVLVSSGLLFGYWLPTQRAQQSAAATRTAASQNATSTALAQGSETASAQSAATATVEQATTIAQNATATAQNAPPTLPYRAPVPGPCGASNAAWTSDAPGYLDCQADRLTLKGGPMGINTIDFALPQFPQNFSVSLDVSHFVGGSTSLVMQINGTTQGYAFIIGLGPENGAFMLAESETTQSDHNSFADLSRTNTIAISLRGATGTFLLNGTAIYTASVPQALITTNISIQIEGSAGDQVDLQNFVLT